MADDRLPAWADALAEGVLLLDGDRVRALNRAAAEMLQVDARRAVGAPLIAVARDHRIERAAAEGVGVEIATRGRRLAVVPIEGALLLRDVTEARRAAGDARELLAVLSHELRTPVTTIHASLEALRFDLPEAQRIRWLARAEEESARLGRLLSDLTIDVAPPHARSVELRALAGRVEALLAPRIADRGVVLTSDLPAAHAWSDPDKLLQVLLNLVENAVLHGPVGAEVLLTAATDPERSSWWRVEVLDRGSAVAPEVMDGWFAPHARGAGATSRGTGLGLYIVRSIVERWGGVAWGRRWAEGNAFGFTVPRDRPAGR
jgi:two-component system, OmpR family, phosphate regulon sensor histidine kinase PhoR